MAVPTDGAQQPWFKLQIRHIASRREVPVLGTGQPQPTPHEPPPPVNEGPPPPPRLLKTHFWKYGSWEALDGCKLLLWGVGTICPPGKHHSENFQQSPQIENVNMFSEWSDLGPYFMDWGGY
jgi:hypothetical protein